MMGSVLSGHSSHGSFGMSRYRTVHSSAAQKFSLDISGHKKFYFSYDVFWGTLRAFIFLTDCVMKTENTQPLSVTCTLEVTLVTQYQRLTTTLQVIKYTAYHMIYATKTCNCKFMHKPSKGTYIYLVLGLRFH